MTRCNRAHSICNAAMLIICGSTFMGCLRLGVGVAVAVPHPPTTSAPLVAAAGTYDTKFDNVDLDEILGQQRLLNNYVRCLEGLGPCTPDAKMLKEVLPDAMTTDCVRCSPRQKYGAQKVTHYLIDHRPDDWTRLEAIYDPMGSFRLAYLASQHGRDIDAPTTEHAAAAAATTTTTPTTPTFVTTIGNEEDNA